MNARLTGAERLLEPDVAGDEAGGRPIEVSVIVPCRNARETIRQCLGSLAVQYTRYLYEVLFLAKTASERSAPRGE